MKATLKFNLPEDQSEFDQAINASKYHSVIWNLDQWLRSETKHGMLPEERDEAYQDIRQKLHEIMEENNVTLD
jgi:hypothetical protein